MNLLELWRRAPNNLLNHNSYTTVKVGGEMSAEYSRSPGWEDSTNLTQCPDMLGFLNPVTYRWGHGTFRGPLIAARVPCCHPRPASSLAASAAWVLESGEKGVRAGGREETNCQGYAWEDD